MRPESVTDPPLDLAEVTDAAALLRGLLGPVPVLSVSAFAFVYKTMQAPPEYVGFVIMGAAMTTFWMNVLWSMGAHLYWERDSGNLGLYIAAPAPLMSILAGMALGGMTTTTVRALAIVTAGVVLFSIFTHLMEVPLGALGWLLWTASPKVEPPAEGEEPAFVHVAR